MRPNHVLLLPGLALLAACGGNGSVIGGPDAATAAPAMDAGRPDTPTPDAADLDAADLDAADLDAATDAPIDRGPACVAAETVCGTRCVDLTTDPAHCGRCDARCADGQVCRAGACALACPAPQLACAGACVTTANDPAHCGECGHACAPGEVCAAGSCRLSCPPAQTACDGACASLDRDPAHCGACGVACVVGASCVAGACRCPTGQALCDDHCVDTATSPSDCGICGRACALGRATAACVAGVCRVGVCEAGFGDCDGRPDNGCEAAVDADVANCGACGRACVYPHGVPGCAGGACALTACEAGFADCDGLAADGCEVDVRSDPRNCGACGGFCPAGVCADGRCVAPRSCLALKMQRPTAPSGRYTIDPDGAGPGAAVEVYCDLFTVGGGWTLVATLTNDGDAPNAGRWLVTSPTPNAWESATAAFGTPDPTRNEDFRSPAFAGVEARAVMITHRNQFLLATDDGCLQGRSLQASLARLDWTCGGSEVFTRHPDCTHACVIASATPRVGDTALLNGVARARLYLKAGEADGAQDTNRDRVYLSTSYRDNVDFPVGLGAFCSGSACNPRVGEADVNDRSDAITPTAGTEFYGVWVR